MYRRSFLKYAGASILASGTRLYAQAVPAAPIVRRLNIETYAKDATLVAALRKSFEILRNRPPSMLVSGFNYAAIHSVLSNDPQIGALPPDERSYWNQCHKDESIFFLWHRAYIRALERNLQALSGRSDLGLPYWDWYAKPSLPDIFRAEYLDPAKTQKNWLYDDRRDPAVQTGAAVWNPTSSGALDEPTFARFQYLLNGNEHGDIHVGIGGSVQGDMGSVPTAARDPIFWLHHCNIDRLLAAWVNHGGTATDQSGLFDGHYKFPIENEADLLPTAAKMDMGEAAPFGIAYESLDAPFAAKPKPVARPAITQRRAASTRKLGAQTFAFNLPQATSVPAKGLSISFARPTKSDSNLLSVLNTVPLEAATTLAVVIEGVRIAKPPRGLTGFDVFINLPDGTTADPRRFKIGSIPLFSLTMESMPGMDMAPTFRFGALSTLRANGALGSSPVVSLVPRYAPYGDQNSDAVGLEVADIRIEASSAPIM